MPDAGANRNELEGRVATFLGSLSPHWLCRSCLAAALDLGVRDVKVGLLRVARFRGRRTVEYACETCAGCGARTAVVRGGVLRLLKRVA
jgi:hypothetical protein